ncbi:TRAM/LAG1/CLN8 domain [Trinorchestia longiramus]|nr:TRAM/LAG1/CLN8 domain [Trinorchestia longiramus]
MGLGVSDVMGLGVSDVIGLGVSDVIGLGFYEHPAMSEDLISSHSRGSLGLASFSLGYFIHDFYDMALYHRKRSSYELMGHHACVIVCFGLAVITQRYVGYAIVALLVEVNSIFLHYRQLLIVEGMSRGCSQYRLTALLNVATFLVFRIAVLGWMTRWLVLHSDMVPWAVYTLGSFSMAVIVLMNIILFFRILIVDFFRQHKTKALQDQVREEGKREQKGSSVTTSTTAIYAPQAEMHLD